VNHEQRQPEDGGVPEAGDGQDQAPQLFERINEAGARKLGEVAAVYGGEGQDAPDSADPADPAKSSASVRGDPTSGQPDDQDHSPGRPEVDSEPPPRIYVASLGDLLVGNSHGAWIDADQDPDSLSDCIDDMLCASQWSTDQWAIHGVQGFYGLHLSGFEEIGRISRLAIGLQAHGEALARWVGYLGTAHIDEALATFAQVYRGHFNGLNAYVLHLSETQQFARYLPAIPQHLLTADLKRIAALLPETTAELYIVDSRDGRMHVFDVSEDDPPEQDPDGGR
jgi:antirestriction protein